MLLTAAEAKKMPQSLALGLSNPAQFSHFPRPPQNASFMSSFPHNVLFPTTQTGP